MQFKVYTIVVTYNGSKWIDKCFGSLVNSTIPLKILAIDNDSSDGTTDIIRKRFPEVEVIETGKDLGFGKANNIGLKRVLEENVNYAFLLNQDAWIEPDTVERLINISNNNSEYGILCPIHLNGKGDAIDRNFQNYLGNTITPGFYSDLYLKSIKNHYISKYANAAAWLITFDCIKQIGGFDPMFKHYGEDDDYINRMQQANLKLAIVPNATIWHDRPQDGKMNDKFYTYQVYTRALLTAKSNFRPKKHFLWRKIIADYFSLLFAHMGKNKDLARNIKADILTLKLLKQTSNQLFQRL